MKILILGGTGWLGGLLAGLAADSGHAVTSLSRNPAPDPHPLVTYAHWDREQESAAGGIATEAWDAIVDVSSEPGQVRRSVRALSGSSQYVYISSCSAYAGNEIPGADESAPTEAPLEADTWTEMDSYGPAKVACEQAVLDAFGSGATTIIRPGLIGGPGDTSNRTTYWPWRFAHPSTPATGVLVPDIADLVTAVLDVRDLAAWTLWLIATRTTGIFNALGEPVSLAHHIRIAREVTGYDGDLVPVSQTWLEEQSVNPWAGPRSIPLWIPMPDYAGFSTRSTARARAAGLTLRPLTETIRDAGKWWTGRLLADPREAIPKSGLTDTEESELIEAAAARPGGVPT